MNVDTLKYPMYTKYRVTKSRRSRRRWVVCMKTGGKVYFASQSWSSAIKKAIMMTEDKRHRAERRIFGFELS